MTLTPDQARERRAALEARRYDQGTVIDVEPYNNGEGWYVSWEDERGGKLHGGFRRVEGLPEPKPGDRIRFYGGFGLEIEGGDLNDTPVWYRTKAERDADHQASKLRRDQEARERFERNRAEMDRNYEALPPVFRDRIEKFRRTNPNWRWEYEAYEMSACIDAVKIGDRAAWSGWPGDWIKDFGKKSWKEQKELIPDLFDGHSGNTFAFALRLAWYYLEQPCMVFYEHGAMTPLTGCKDYGCPHPPPADLMARNPMEEQPRGKQFSE